MRVQDLPSRYRGDQANLATATSSDDERPMLLGKQATAPAQPASQPSGLISRISAPDSGNQLPSEGMDLRDHMASIELTLINEALERTQGVVAHAAQLLGLRRTTLVEKLRKYGIERDSAEASS